MSILESMIQEASSIAILGHIHPDGDCLGSSLGLWNYLRREYPQIHAVVYLEEASRKFSYMSGFDKIRSHVDDETYDLCICLDCGSEDRLGEFLPYLKSAKKSLCLDHHIPNTRYAQVNLVADGASSACEVLYEQLRPEAIDQTVAECLYTGIVHDTGVFKFSSTSARTMEIAGKLMEKGIDFGEIIDGSFYRKTYVQNQILGRALLESITFMDGKCIFSAIKKKDMDFYGVTSKDLDGIIDQLRLTEGVECALFLYETGPQQYKVSMRSQHVVDVSRIAAYFGGGGHVRAAGCTMNGSIHDVINNLAGHIAKELEEAEA